MRRQRFQKSRHYRFAVSFHRRADLHDGCVDRVTGAGRSASAVPSGHDYHRTRGAGYGQPGRAAASVAGTGKYGLAAGYPRTAAGRIEQEEWLRSDCDSAAYEGRIRRLEDKLRRVRGRSDANWNKLQAATLKRSWRRQSEIQRLQAEIQPGTQGLGSRKGRGGPKSAVVHDHRLSRPQWDAAATDLHRVSRVGDYLAARRDCAEHRGFLAGPLGPGNPLDDVGRSANTGDMSKARQARANPILC